MSKTVKTMIIASIGAVLSISSMQVSAVQPSKEHKPSRDHHPRKDLGGPRELCFHIATTPNHPDPEGSYVAVKIEGRSVLRLDGGPLLLRGARGMAIGRAPMPGAPEPFGDWVGTPLTGTCHKHFDELQCSFQSISSITTLFPPGGPTPPIAAIQSSIETGAGHLTFVHNLKDMKTIMSQIGSVNVTYFDLDGNPIPDDKAPLPTFKKIKDFFTGVEKVKCKHVPHPEIPPFHIP